MTTASAAPTIAETFAEIGSRKIEATAIYTAAEAARLVRMHVETMREKLRGGIIKGSRRSGDWRVLGSELLKLALPSR